MNQLNEAIITALAIARMVVFGVTALLLLWIGLAVLVTSRPFLLAGNWLSKRMM